jgi:hypothetical protein
MLKAAAAAAKPNAVEAKQRSGFFDFYYLE